MTYSDLLPVSSDAGAAAQKAPGAYNKELNWQQGEGWRGSFLTDCLLAETIAPFLRPIPQSQQVGTISESLSTWLKLFPPTPQVMPEIIPHTTCRPNQIVSSGFSLQVTCFGSCCEFS